MTQQTIEVEGLPEGWKAVAYRKPIKGENYLDSNGIQVADYNYDNPWLIVEKIQPRRIVLEETEEERSVSYGDWYENKTGMIGQWTEAEFGSSLCFKIWHEVKE